MMEIGKRPLGESGFLAWPMALGSWAMGGAVETWGYVDDNESIAAIRHAAERGVDLIDTAPIYGLGHGEEVVGAAIRDLRDRVIVASKCGLLFPSSRREPPQRCLRAESVIRECEASLRRLRTDRIDLYQCHWPDPDTPIGETMAALVRLLEEEKIRAIGLSNFSCEQISAAREHGPVHCVQAPFSMLHRRAAEDLIPYCREHGIAFLAYSPLSKGILTGKFSLDSTFNDVRGRDPDYAGETFRRHLEAVEKLKPIAEKHGKSLAQLALHWVVHFPGVTAPIMGAKRVSQVEENLGALGWDLPMEDRDAIDSILDERDASG